MNQAKLVMRSGILAAALLSLLVSSAAALADSSPSAAAAAWPGRTGRYVFQVMRDGTSIGTQSIEIKRDGDALTAVTESTIAVKLLGVVIYRMHQVITETYRGERLVAVRADTKDSDGERIADLTRDGNHWTGSLNKEPRSFDCDCMASPMWHLASVSNSRVIEASQARLRQISVQERGTEILTLPEGRTAVRHYSIKGEIERDVWYDSHGNLVAATQVGSDGSHIRQVLIRDPSGAPATGDQAADPVSP